LDFCLVKTTKLYFCPQQKETEYFGNHLAINVSACIVCVHIVHRHSQCVLVNYFLQDCALTSHLHLFFCSLATNGWWLFLNFTISRLQKCRRRIAWGHGNVLVFWGSSRVGTLLNLLDILRVRPSAGINLLFLC